jgi:hypothetical protein
VIINRVLSPTGEELAITSNGEDKPVTLIPRSDSESQQVSIFLKNHWVYLPDWLIFAVDTQVLQF